MQTPEAAYMDLKQYLLDFDARIQLRKQWQTRHPDADAIHYCFDAFDYHKDPEAWTPSGKSTFDPNDPVVETADVFTSDRLVDILTVIVDLFETRKDR